MNGFTLTMTTVLPGLAEGKTYKSVRSRRGSSPGDLSLAALKWLDIRASLVPRAAALRARTARGAAARELPGSAHELDQVSVDLVCVGPRDRVRAAVDHDRLHVADHVAQSRAGLGIGQNPVLVT